MRIHVPHLITVDGNEAAALVAHRTHEVIAIDPITPSSAMGALSDEWSSKGRTNIWGQVPTVIEMQSEGRRGRAAIFADCGMGKTRMQLEWARQIRPSGGRVLIVCPLAVAEQTQKEGVVLGIEVERVTVPGSADYQITNYQRLHHFVGAPYDALILDESSILKSIDGKTRTLLLKEFTSIKYRLACTVHQRPTTCPSWRTTPSS